MDYSRKKNSYIALICVSLITFFMWILFAGSSKNPDYLNFENIYSQLQYLPRYSGVEFGFSYFMKLLGSIGLSYQQFLMVEATIFMILLLRVVFYFSEFPIMTLIIYIYFPFFLDIVQIRNSLAFIIVLNGFIYLFEKKTMNYIILVCIASLFHTTSLFYLLFLLINFNKKTIQYISIALTILFFSFRDAMISFLMSILPSGQKYEVYLSGISIVTLGFYILFICLNYFLSEVFYKRFIKLNNIFENYNREVSIAAFTTKISNLSLIILPLLSLDSDFFRLFRNLYLLIIINFVNYYGKKIYIWKAKDLIIDGLVIIYIIFIGYNYIYHYQWEDVFIDVITNNYFYR